MSRIWRTGDAPLAPGTRVRALVVENVTAAVRKYGTVAERQGHGAGLRVEFGKEIESNDGYSDREWWVAEAEVLDDGGEQ
ncbi:hypothetical protein [Kineosporia sp. NBRC 101731]|uniref:hypothetical protein n=1 Tax=Kineosporia sp. NBRC 101731 TaxID=3032199 RepID=UPI0024A4D233|nr:hypothetical protein [Kineosporia sp. NBRC 101731]GLY32031.1 hypothetical protein Kisp02_53960 [Kineosporia sp. NBRC 101731]